MRLGKPPAVVPPPASNQVSINAIGRQAMNGASTAVESRGSSVCTVALSCL
jgi:hypothetical protein